MPNYLGFRRADSWFARLAESYLGKKSAVLLVALLFAVPAQAQETLVALPTAEVDFPAPGATGFTAGQPADRSAYTQAVGVFNPDDGWTATVWAILNTEWREDHMGVVNLRWMSEKNTVRSASAEFSVANTAITRNVFIGGEARTAFLVGNLGNYTSGTHNWLFWASQEGVSGEDYQKRIDYVVVQFRVHGAESGEGTGTVINPNGVGLSNPDQFNPWHWENRQFANFRRSWTQTAPQNTGNLGMNKEGWGNSLGTEAFAWDGEDDDIDWNYSIPVPGTSPVVLNVNPATLGSAIGGTNGTSWASVIVPVKQAIRLFLLILLYAMAAKRVVHLLAVG